MLKIHDKDAVIYDGMTLPTLHQRLQAARAEIGLNVNNDCAGILERKHLIISKGRGHSQWQHYLCPNF